MSCILLIPLMMAEQFSQNEVFANILGSLLVASSSSSILAQFLIGLDQFLAVIDPLHYHRRLNKIKCHILCVSSWFISLICAILSFYFGHNFTFVIVFFTIIFAIPYITLTYMYTRIFLAAHENAVKTRFSSESSSNSYDDSKYQLSTQSSVTSHQHSISAKSEVSLANNLKRKLSNVSDIILHREESRAIKISFLILMTILMCWMPYFIVMLIGTSRLRLATWAKAIMILLVTLSPVLTPFIYGFRSQRVQKEILKSFGIEQKSKQSTRIRTKRNSIQKEVKMITLNCNI